ncbi:MAG: hypothetical protein M9949_04560 [Candidatus Kapabacteria bacterium]|nr:hypothetical protein [Candidatus Kapabacteria bacterium]
MKSYWIILLIILPIILAGCPEKNNPTIPNPKDTCEGKRNLVPEIKIYETNFTVKEPLLVQDTVLVGNDITFVAPPGFSSYKWQIGLDEREFTTEKVTFWFSWDKAYTNLPIRLIVRNPIECFEYTQEYDTVHTSIFLQHKRKAKILGEYFGTNDNNPLDTMTVEIFFQKDEPTSSLWYVKNINRGCGYFPTSGFKKNLITNKQVIIDMNGSKYEGCYHTRGEGYLVSTDEDSLIFDYAWGENIFKGDTIFQTFRGRRIK